MEVVQHSYGEPGVYDLLASDKMILEGYFYIFTQARVLHSYSSDISSKDQGLLIEYCKSITCTNIKIYILFFSYLYCAL